VGTSATALPAEPPASRALVVASVLGVALLAVGGVVLAAFVIRAIAAHVDVGRGG
jgi:hypothetical protein